MAILADSLQFASINCWVFLVVWLLFRLNITPSTDTNIKEAKKVISEGKYKVLLLFVFASQLLTAQSNTVKGTVTDENGKYLFSANVILIGTELGASTTFEGNYRIDNIPAGKYKIQISYVGYTKQIFDVEIFENRFIEIDCHLKPESFKVGGITVTAKENLLPRDIATKTDINSGEIEHYQATNLGDVLDLVPGVQKSANPGVSKTSQIAIRASEGDNTSAFGTKVIIDGEPISNNSNLQFEALTGSKFGGSDIGGSVDLREIPADNLESVSVISGMPSVRYGDFSNGIIELRTKMGVAPHRIKIKNNPQNTEANFGGGFGIENNSLNLGLFLALPISPFK